MYIIEIGYMENYDRVVNDITLPLIILLWITMIGT